MSQDLPIETAETHQPPANSGGPSPIRVAQKSQGQPGGFWRRALANLLDGFITSIASLPVTFGIGVVFGILGLSEGILTALSYLIGWGVTIAYYGWFFSNKGASPGKMVMNLKVVNVESGTHLGFWQAGLVRQILGMLACAFTLGIGWFIIPFRSDKRGLHDFIAGSQVLHIKDN